MLYPEHLHDDHYDFPLAPEKLIITEEMLSQEMREFIQKYSLKFSKQERLTQTFLPKKKYVGHIKNIAFYKSQGLIITNIERGVIFNQSNWMNEYIELNTLRRINSRSKFEKDFFKLLVGNIADDSGVTFMCSVDCDHHQSLHNHRRVY